MQLHIGSSAQVRLSFARFPLLLAFSFKLTFPSSIVFLLVFDRPTLLCTSEHGVCESCIDAVPVTRKREVPRCAVCTMVISPDEASISVVLGRQVGQLP